jgi:hypothetical protein
MLKIVYSFPFHAITDPRIHVLTQEQDRIGTVVCPSDVDSLINDDKGPEEVTGTVEVHVVPGQLTFVMWLQGYVMTRCKLT